MKKNKKDLQRWLRGHCFEIRNLKTILSDMKNNNSEEYDFYKVLLEKERLKHRHHHIAYSQLKGRKRKEVEQNSKTKPQSHWIKSIIKEYS